MAQPQGPKNEGGSRTQDTHKSGKKKPPTDSDRQKEKGFALSKTLARTDRVGQQVEELNDLSQQVGQARLAIGVWVLENIFWLKKPKKKNSFAAISKHPGLGSTRRRPVAGPPPSSSKN
jgi:hypothetical protein